MHPQIHVRLLQAGTGHVDQDTLFADISDLYPECLVFIKESPKLSPFICFLNNDCTVGKNCMDIVHHRVFKLFEAFPSVTQLICKFGIEGLADPSTLHSHKPVTQHKKQRQRGVVFFKTGDVKYISFNTYAYDYRMKKRGTLYRIDTQQLDWYRTNFPQEKPPERDPSIINSNDL